MNQQLDPRIANVVYNFLGTTLAQLNEIDKNNLGSSSLKALKTDPKNVFRINADSSMNLMPSYPVETAPVPDMPAATVVAAPNQNVVNAGINVAPVQQSPVVQTVGIKGAEGIKKQIDVIINALNILKTFLNE